MVQKKFSFLVSAIVALFAAVVPASAQTAAQWHSWPQYQRNTAILSKAYAQVGQYTGLQCKHWVQNIVWSASNGAVWLPQNKPNNYEWYSHQYVYRYYLPFPTQWCQPGMIIQMKWNGLPHTAIVAANNQTGMWWLDCNWGTPSGTVKYHYITHANFNNKVGSNYSVYEVR